MCPTSSAYVVKYFTTRKYSSKVHLFPKFSKSISSVQCRRFVFSSRSKSCTFCILTPFVVSRVSSFVLSDRTVTTEIAHELDHSKYVGKLSQLCWRIRDISETPLHNTVRPNEVCPSTVMASCYLSSFSKSSSSHGTWSYTLLSSTHFVDP